ncbi:choice-of-anchor L domain-containing protein [Reinekea sp.]|jgi:hypothetical protein|uniref:choice-of-anchor L domain-containing protein n=1 Tax=Reinekea sp. TaxID=1970455 RepID=UPI003988D561
MNELRAQIGLYLKTILVVCLSTLSVATLAETIAVKDDVTVQKSDLVSALVGTKVSLSNVELSGRNAQFGLFSGFEFLFGTEFDSGVIMSTGKVSSVISEKNKTDKVSNEFNRDAVNDIDLGNGVYDPAKLTLSFTPEFDVIVLDFIFGSEEYNEYVHSEHNDKFVILVNGENCAKTPDNQIFSIDSVNDRANYPPVYGQKGASSNANLYINNDPGIDVYKNNVEDSKAPYATEMDGFTRKIRCVADVHAGVTNKIIIGIVDDGDAKLDSWVFFRANSLSSTVIQKSYDSDHDGIADIIEGNKDTDNDGIPDYLDLDSDNDGIPDAMEDIDSPVLLGFDHDNDGIVDALDVDLTGGLDENNNGIDDALEPTDTDKDGIPDHIDLDSDNDGILDAIESGRLPELTGVDTDLDGLDDALDVDQTKGQDANHDGIDDAFALNDSDNDGMPDVYDLDSDNDGIPDSVEFQGNPNIDADLDGRIDDATDKNNDGLADIISLNAVPVDTDSDGLPDYLDLDSDNDGLTDLKESLPLGIVLSVLDADKNGQLDSTEDRDHDGLIDVVDSIVVNGKAGSSVSLIDIDGDGLPAYRDVDTDGDGFTDDMEDGDFNNDGINDRLQKMPSLKTAVSGIGIGSLGIEYLMLLPLLILLRRKNAAKI